MKTNSAPIFAHESHLAAKVSAVNELNRLIILSSDLLCQVVTSYVGKKIVNNDGSLLKAFKKDITAVFESEGLKERMLYNWVIDTNHKYSIYIDYSYSNMFKRGDDHVSHRATKTIALAGISNQNICDSGVSYSEGTFRTNYTPEEIREYRSKLIKTESAVSKLECLVKEFGRYDS
jgi:hypothetical protein